METLDKIYQNDFNLYEVLNSFANSGNKFRKKSFFIDIIIQVYSCNRSEAATLWEEVDMFFSKKISYICEIEDESETLFSTFLQENCTICNKKINEHENFLLYQFVKKKELSDFNNNLLKNFFLPGSIPVIKLLKSNFNNLIPFVGAGISKDLGLPLWLEMLYSARDHIASIYYDTFDFYYDSKDINKLIGFIQDISLTLDSDKKIKKLLILPQVRIKLNESIATNSIAHHILKLNSPYVITTNYDMLLEQINTKFSLGYDESKNLNNFSGFDDLDKEKFIFHIHGDVNDADSMIVTENDYIKMYDEQKNKKVLTGLIMRKSLLFMGFSLNDKYFLNEFSDICAANKDYATNYMICLENQPPTNLIRENINYITMRTVSINKDPYDSKEQYRYLLNYINGHIFTQKNNPEVLKL